MQTLETHGVSDFEPFGFRDGISQPYVPELASRSDDLTARPVALGEFLLGYPNAYGRFTQRPVLPEDGDPRGLLPRLPAGVDDTHPRGGADLGRNGSYLVLRTLAQDVGAFETYLSATAQQLDVDRAWLAAKLVGRWRSGAPLALAPEADRPKHSTENHFAYHDDDSRGLRFRSAPTSGGRIPATHSTRIRARMPPRRSPAGIGCCAGAESSTTASSAACSSWP